MDVEPTIERHDRGFEADRSGADDGQAVAGGKGQGGALRAFGGAMDETRL